MWTDAREMSKSVVTAVVGRVAGGGSTAALPNALTAITDGPAQALMVAVPAVVRVHLGVHTRRAAHAMGGLADATRIDTGPVRIRAGIVAAAAAGRVVGRVGAQIAAQNIRVQACAIRVPTGEVGRADPAAAPAVSPIAAKVVAATGGGDALSLAV